MESPQTIPVHLRSAYTLNGQIPVYDWYINGVVPAKSVMWCNHYIQSFIDRFTFDNILNNRHGYESYINAALFHVTACKKYTDAIRNKKVAVIGSESPWIEAILVNAGAQSVTTVEYNVPMCIHNTIYTMSYDDFRKSTDKYDAIFSYSSIEHTGLGRYGDPLNPNGDINTMADIYNALNNDGLCFLGIPVGKDALVWNAHRIYGEKRLKLLYLDKFKELEWIGYDKNYIYTCPEPSTIPAWDIQPIIVLQK